MLCGRCDWAMGDGDGDGGDAAMAVMMVKE